MKKQFVLLSLLLAGSVATAMAQKNEQYYSESAKDNWYISVGVGTQTLLNQTNIDYKLSETLTPAFALTVGHQINPVWGYRAQVAGWQNKLWAEAKPKETQRAMHKKDAFQLHTDAVFNISNAIAGYNANRLFTLSAFAGPGLTFANKLVDAKSNGTDMAINGSLGLLGLFNINDHFDVNVEVRGELAPSIFNVEERQYTDGRVAALVGVTYTFGGKKYAPVIVKANTKELNDQINRYREALNNTEMELAKAKSALTNVQHEVQEVVKIQEVKYVTLPAIFFQKGKADIDSSNKMNLTMIAQIIKDNPGKKYTVTGYADNSTGSDDINNKLSEKRAQNVYNALIKDGIDVSQLEYVGLGGTSKYKDIKLNRAVIVE